MLFLHLLTCIECNTGNNSVTTAPTQSSCSSCLKVQSTITLLVDDEAPDDVKTLFVAKLDEAISAGSLDVPGFNETEDQTNPPDGNDDETVSSGGLSMSAVIGIACAAFAAGVLTIAGLYTNRQRQERRRKAMGASPPCGSSPSDTPGGSPMETNGHKILPVGTAAVVDTRELLGDENNKNSGSDEDMGSLADSDVSSSQAGSSGWSSSAGLSSLNTGSFDSHDLESGTVGSGSPTNLHKSLAALAAVGVATRLDDRHRSTG